MGGGVDHQDVSKPEICDVETSEMEVDADPQDVGSDGEGTSNSKKDLSNKEESSIGSDSDNEQIMKTLETGTQMMTMVHISMMTMMNSSRFGALKTIFHCILNVDFR